MTYLFFSKMKSFPKIFIAVTIFNFTFVVADAFVGKAIFPDEPVFDPDTTKEVARALGMIIVWVPYMLLSERVKRTFVK